MRYDSWHVQRGYFRLRMEGHHARQNAVSLHLVLDDVGKVLHLPIPFAKLALWSEGLHALGKLFSQD
ncbi:Uncharacterised protein [Streptococcus pneumoniae]|nr:Uncharacterised protein [Streptococcus pneumoniae]